MLDVRRLSIDPMRYPLQFGIGLAASFAPAYFGGIAAYNALEWLGFSPFFEPMHMPPHHLAHHQQYIALVAVFYGLFSTLWALHFGSARGWRRWCGIALCFLGVVICSGAVGGPLYYIHDFQSGYWPSHEMVERQLVNGIPEGIFAGAFVMALSIPLNVLALLCGALLTARLPQLVKRV